MNKDPIKCCCCGKFISYKDLEAGKSSVTNTTSWDGWSDSPDETSIFECRKCINKESSNVSLAR